MSLFYVPFYFIAHCASFFSQFDSLPLTCLFARRARLDSKAAKALLETAPQPRDILLLVGSLGASNPYARAFQNFSRALLQAARDEASGGALLVNSTTVGSSTSAVAALQPPICAFLDCSRSGALCGQAREKWDNVDSSDTTILLIPTTKASNATFVERMQSAFAFRDIDQGDPNGSMVNSFVSLFGTDQAGLYLAPLTARNIDALVLQVRAQMYRYFWCESSIFSPIDLLPL